LGAGPAGTSCALALKDSGLKVALLEKMTFPRDKICGDAISTNAFNFFKKTHPQYFNALSEFESKVEITSTRFVSSSKRETILQWNSKTINCSRLYFDNFLFELVKNNQKTSIHLNTEVLDINPKDDVIEIQTSNGKFKASVLICCDGAQSLAAKKLKKFQIHKKHYGAAVRSYFDMPDNTLKRANEVFFSKKYPQGYLWIFPVSGTTYNVGFGMLSQAVSKIK
jgi:flavin-dependent dehydrogenase